MAKLVGIEITFLGTGGSIPTSKRGLSAIAVRRNNEFILFDCGEGTQRQMVQAGLGFHKKEKIFITHMHGDHVLGLPGLLQTMSLLGRTKDLQIYGPEGIKKFVETINETVRYSLTFPVEIFEKDEGIICDVKEYQVIAAKSVHIDPSVSYAFVEKPRPGRFNAKKARKLGVPQGSLWSKLQSGEKVMLADGKIIEPEMVLGKPRLGRKIVYTGDTCPSEAIVELAKDADLLIHESTFEDSMTKRAKEDGHSTPSMAAKTAKKARVKQLILTHISARYRDPSLLLQQATKTFKNTLIAEDFLKIELPLSNN
jgi:ribonuclease Z